MIKPRRQLDCLPLLVYLPMPKTGLYLILLLTTPCILFGSVAGATFNAVPQEQQASSSAATIKWSQSSVRKIYDPPGRHYSYAPSAIMERKTERYWICQNQEDGVVRDSIFYLERAQGEIILSKPVLTAGAPGAWDSFHVCDPCVIAGQFRFNEIRYKYALFYLGNDVDASRHNQIGVAFANDLGGIWIKYPQPIVTCADDHSWGVGQPSVTSLNRKGRLLLFYTLGSRTATRGLWREIDLSDMSRPLLGATHSVPNAGLTNINGRPDFINNFDVVYDPRRARFYAVREQHPYPQDHPSYIASSQQVVSISKADLRSDGKWRVEGEITPALTGQPRNHNACIERTLYGTLPHHDSIRVVFAASCAGCEGRAEWSYNLWEIKGKIMSVTTRVSTASNQ